MKSVYFANKQHMTEGYLGQTRVPLTKLELLELKVASVVEKGEQKTAHVVFGQGRKNPGRSQATIFKKAGVKTGKLREIMVQSEQELKAGDTLTQKDLIQPGSVLTVQSQSKGKGFAGGVKRHGFAGGPKTHGQSDRHRAPGSIGQGTTPGRVHRGKKMAGHMGAQQTTIKNLLCVAVSGNSIWVTGPVPGAQGSLVKLTLTNQKEAPTLTFLKGYEAKAEEEKTQ